jgi:hypothetical protein
VRPVIENTTVGKFVEYSRDIYDNICNSDESDDSDFCGVRQTTLTKKITNTVTSVGKNIVFEFTQTFIDINYCEYGGIRVMRDLDKILCVFFAVADTAFPNKWK